MHFARTVGGGQEGSMEIMDLHDYASDETWTGPPSRPTSPSSCPTADGDKLPAFAMPVDHVDSVPSETHDLAQHMRIVENSRLMSKKEKAAWRTYRPSKDGFFASYIHPSPQFF